MKRGGGDFFYLLYSSFFCLLFLPFEAAVFVLNGVRIVLKKKEVMPWYLPLKMFYDAFFSRWTLRKRFKEKGWVGIV
jgi:hypothetical protein